MVKMSNFPVEFSSSPLPLSRNTTMLGPHHHFAPSLHCCAWLATTAGVMTGMQYKRKQQARGHAAGEGDQGWDSQQ
jgi:hypothetical protein